MPEPIKILLVEDNVLNQVMACSFLKKEGHIFDVVDNGQDAIKQYFKNGYDIILMDLHTTGMGGMEATSKIRSKSGDVHRVKIIAMSASERSSNIHKCLDAGMDEYIQKPFNAKELKSKINQLMLDSKFVLD